MDTTLADSSSPDSALGMTGGWAAAAANAATPTTEETPATSSPSLPPGVVPFVKGQQPITGGAGAAAAAATQQIAKQPADQQANAAPAQPAAQPIVIHPVRRGGLAGIRDEMRDAIAGTSSSRVATDSEGNTYVNVSPLSHKQQWMKVAATLAEGAAAGYAAGRGSGREGQAALAGFGVGHHEVEQRDQHRQELTEEVKRDQLNKYNQVMLKHQIAAGDFALTRMQVNATEQDVKFAQEQVDREHNLGSADLGVYADPKDFTKIAAKNPQFWKDFYQDPGRIVAVPEIGADGQRKGIHVFMRTTGVGDQVVPKGTKVHDFMPGEKPTDPPQLVERTLNTPATYNQVDTWNAASMKKYQDWQTANQKELDTESQKKLRDAQTTEAQENVKLRKAEEAKNWAEVRKLKLEGDQLSGTGSDQPIAMQAKALVDGRGAPSQLSKRSKDYNAILAEADKQSIAATGKPYDRELGEIRYLAYKDTVLNYSDPSKPGAQTIASFDKFLGHSLDASEGVNAMRNRNSGWVNVPYNSLRKGLGSKSSPELVVGMARLETVRKEWQTLLANNHALKAEDIDLGKTILSDTATPAQIQGALKAFAGTAVVRLRAEDFGASRVLHQHIPELISPEGAKALQHFGYDPDSVYSKNVNSPQAQQPQQQAKPQAPAGATPPEVYAADGKTLIGHVVNNTFVPLGKP